MNVSIHDFPLSAYCVNNMYFMGIQAGIQSAHSLADLVYDYSVNDYLPRIDTTLFSEWIENHKTMIIVNGGDTKMLVEFNSLVELSSFPHSEFFETGVSKDCLSNVCVIAPDARGIMKYLDEYINPLDVESRYAFCGGEQNHDTLAALSRMRLAS